MNDKLKKSEIDVAKSFKKVLEAYNVRNIKEISFNNGFFNIGFSSRKSAEAALNCNLLEDYNYVDQSEYGFKYKHRLIGRNIL